MQEVYTIVQQAASTTAPVLIAGESGTGKELVARTIHALGPRAKGPFVAVNCSAIPESLLESELFGHERGAFTGALERRAGYFELADQGTLFLDEIAEMSAALQAKYLRVLQDGVIRRLGGKTELKVDVRVIAATNKDPVAAMKQGTFREDLFYRLNVFSMTMPPLRQRKEDIPAARRCVHRRVRGEVRQAGEVARREDALEILKQPRVAGQRARAAQLHRAGGDRVRRSRRSPPRCSPWPSARRPRRRPPAAAGAAAPPPNRARACTLDEAERVLILKTLAALGNNKTRAAESLGISLKTLHNKLRRYSAS